MNFYEKPCWEIPTASDISNFERVADALKYAGLDWEVAKEPLFFRTGKKSLSSIPGHFAVVRRDTHRAFGTVKGRYLPVQNSETFGWVDNLLKVPAATPVLDRAGSIGGGRIVWMMLDSMAGGFTLKTLVSNGHGGSAKSQITHLVLTDNIVVARKVSAFSFGRYRRW